MVRKEIRALLPTWLPCLGVLTVCVVPGLPLPPFAGLVYVLGTAAVASQAFGHEYTSRTLPLLLSQPVSRQRLFAVKTFVLSAILLTLTAVVMIAAVLTDATRMWPLPVLAAPAVCAFCLAPWLTMVFRNPLAGLVFTIAIPGTIVAAASAYGLAPLFLIHHGPTTIALRSLATAGLCAAAIAGARRFQRLEAMDGGVDALELPRLAPASATARGHRPLTALIAKELRLHQPTVVIAGLYVIVSATLAMSAGSQAQNRFLQPVLTGFYLFTASVFAGSLAVAEERQFGTWAIQAVAPVSPWRQWAVKAAVTLFVALVLAAALPALTSVVVPNGLGSEPRAPSPWLIAAAVVLCTACGLYVSSLATTAMQAFVVSAALSGGVFLLAAWMTHVAYTWRIRHMTTSIRAIPEPVFATLQVGAGTVLVSMLLGLGYVNYRTEDRSHRRVIRQAWSIAGILVPLVTLLIVRRL